MGYTQGFGNSYLLLIILFILLIIIGCTCFTG
ncbi:YjcZ family sporulation protein [Fictibacillus macauensis]|nr:YjcZ family sporulation protein [Fictibacillus macauensis]